MVLTGVRMKRMLVESLRPNPLFVQLSEALELDAVSTQLLTSEMLAQLETTPATLTHAQLLGMRDELMQVVEYLFPAPERPAARSRLAELLA